MTANVCDECGTDLDENAGGLCVTCAWWQDDEERRGVETPC